MLIFVEGGKPENPGKKPSEEGREPNIRLWSVAYMYPFKNWVPYLKITILVSMRLSLHLAGEASEQEMYQFPAGNLQCGRYFLKKRSTDQVFEVFQGGNPIRKYPLAHQYYTHTAGYLAS